MSNFISVRSLLELIATKTKIIEPQMTMLLVSDLVKLMDEDITTPYEPIATLVQCHESALKIDILISLTKIESDDVITALKRHYVDGAPIKNLDISQQAFSRASIRLNETYRKVQQLNGVL